MLIFHGFPKSNKYAVCFIYDFKDLHIDWLGY